MNLTIRPADRADREAVLALLDAQALPVVGVPDDLDDYAVAERDGLVVGVAGLELYPDGALLRSVAVAAGEQGGGVGRQLVEDALRRAHAARSPGVWLLTTTADRWFPRFGFRVADRASAPPGVAGSVEFREACPASAVAMELGGAALSSRAGPSPMRP